MSTSEAQDMYDSYPLTSEGYAGLIREANDAAESIDQDWDAETTTYIFADGSSLVDCNGDIEVVDDDCEPKVTCVSCRSFLATTTRYGVPLCDGCAEAVDGGAGISDAYAVVD